MINRNKTRNNTQKIKVLQKQSADTKHNIEKDVIEQKKIEEKAIAQRKAEEEAEEKAAAQRKAEEKAVERRKIEEKAEEQRKYKEHLISLSYAELRKEAKASNIKNYWRKKQQQLVEELTKING